MPTRLTRRSAVQAALGGALAAGWRPASAQTTPPAFSYPIGLPGGVLGDGFFMRHGYAVENTWFQPGSLHTGEDWYLGAGETAGAGVYAAAAGEVVFGDYDYPGAVVIVRHAADLFSMYGHLEYQLPVAVGERVERGQPLGRVLRRADAFPSHLHFEFRTFLTTAEVNGAAPRYRFACGPECAPGPGYWPIAAPEHPSVIGWRNPTHAINGRASPMAAAVGAGSEVVVSASAEGDAALWSTPEDEEGAEQVGSLPLRAGDRFELLAIEAGLEAATGTSAEAYRLWYRIGLPDGAPGWVQAAIPSSGDTGSDGRPSSVRFDFVPALIAG